VGMGWNPTGTQWDSFGHFQKFARNPRSPLGILGIHWDSTGKGGSVISTGFKSCNKGSDNDMIYVILVRCDQ
jgi:hypothetical protein